MPPAPLVTDPPAGEGASDGTVPVLAGQPYTVIAKQIVDFRAGVRGDPRMAHFTDRRHLAFSQPIADVAMYIARLPAPRAKVPPASESVVHGAMLYARACERCHGVSAEGKEDTLAPRLASQHFGYVLQQLNDAAEGRRPPMAETHTNLVRDLRSGDLKAVAAFLTSLPSFEDK
jgi:cytochrome c553